MRPIRSILDASFSYVPSVSTSVASTWRRAGWRPTTDEERKARRQPTAELTKTSLAFESAHYRGTGGVSENNRNRGFQAAFIDRDTETVHLSRFPDGRLAPCHLLDGLPAQLVLARNEQGRVTRVKSSVVSGFVRDERFYTRDEAAAMLVSASEFDQSRRPDTSLRKAA